MKAPKQMHSGNIMINRDCSHCGSDTAYTINIESYTHWYFLVAQENKNNKKRGLYFLCSNCYAQQIDKNSEWNPIIKSKWQNRKEARHKTMEISVITRLLQWFLYLIHA
jgi:hypothetical protein